MKPEEYQQKLLERYDINKNCYDDLEMQSVAFEQCQKTPIAFFKYWLWTYNPRVRPPDRAFIPYDYQEVEILSYNQEIVTGEESLTEKSRDMGVTWMILGLYVYRWLFFDENYLCGSRKEDLVDTLGDMDTHFERMRYILKKLPDWMIEMCGWDRRNQGYLKIYKDNGASIVGEAMSPDFSRQGRYNAILLDEFAFVESAEAIWRSCGDSAPCKHVVSTPNGKNNHFAKLRDSGKIKVHTIHWRLHPTKDQAWYEEQKSRRTDKDVAQELDISYSVSAGEAFYKGFVRALHVRKMHINKDRELMLSWDFGFHHPNCSIHQISVDGIWIIVDNIFGEDVVIDEFAEIVNQYLNENYNGYLFKTKGYGDPAGLQGSDKSKKSSIKILAEHGFPVKTLPSNMPTTNYTARKSIIEKRLKTLIGGCPGLVVNDHPNNAIIIEGFEGGYHFPKANTVGMVRETPEKDSYYEHPFNTIEYFATNMYRPTSKMEEGQREHHKVFKARPRPPQPNAGFGFKKG